MVDNYLCWLFIINLGNEWILRLVIFMQLLVSFCRGREIRRMKSSMKSGNSFAFLTLDINELEHSNQANLPRVTVVMPLKGFGEHNLHNWRSQVNDKKPFALECSLIFQLSCVLDFMLWFLYGIFSTWK